MYVTMLMRIMSNVHGIHFLHYPAALCRFEQLNALSKIKPVNARSFDGCQHGIVVEVDCTKVVS